MVNALYHVLAALRETETTVSGERLSGQLGISRVAIWKHIRELRRQGYGVESYARGYRLVSVPDLLLPGEFPGWESRIQHFTEIDSTMRVARELARAGADEGTVVIAEKQTRGRGRLGRMWMSPAGGIYLTVITRPRVAPTLAPRANLIAAVAVATTLQAMLGVSARVKWPNDVLIEGKKVCGILSEMEAESDTVHYINVGIGMNVNVPVGDAVLNSVSLAESVGKPVDRVRLTRQLVTRLLQYLRELDSPTVLEMWKEMSDTLGRHVSIQQGEKHVKGLAVDVVDSGALVVRGPDGVNSAVFAGDCLYEET